MQIEADWGHKVSGLVLEYDQNVPLGSILIKLQNGPFYYRQAFYNPTSVECLGLDYTVEYTVEYTTANQGIMRQAHNI
jgi:hypothetical protein